MAANIGLGLDGLLSQLSRFLIKKGESLAEVSCVVSGIASAVQCMYVEKINKMSLTLSPYPECHHFVLDWKRREDLSRVKLTSLLVQKAMKAIFTKKHVKTR